MGELTRVLSCGKNMRAVHLVDMWGIDNQNDNEGIVDVWFPEVGISPFYIPRTEYEVWRMLPELVGKTVVTTSEIVILMMLREVRKGRMRTDELELWCGDMKIGVATNGDMIDPWDGGFFELGFNLRFH